MKAILFASTNSGKLTEVREQAVKSRIKIFSTEQYRMQQEIGAAPEIDENALTYEGNAALKAEGLFIWSGGFPTLADDSGLEVEALGGDPGVNTARYAGVGAGSAENINKLLSELDNIENRNAKFICSLCLKISPDEIITARAEFPGKIALSPYGKGGFGYDPVFIPDGYSKTLSELKENKIDVPTHRILALRNLFSQIGLAD